MYGDPQSLNLFPYTTLFRSEQGAGRVLIAVDAADHAVGDGGREVGGQVEGVAHRQRPVAGLHLVAVRSEEHTSELQSRENLVCRLLLEKKKKQTSLIAEWTF